MNFVIIGCGRMGSRRAKSIERHEEGEVIQVADVKEDAARELGNEIGAPFTTDIDSTVQIDDAENVVISVPNVYHSEITCKALKNGKNVLCEKPLASDPVEAREMVRQSVDSHSTLKVSSNLRYFPTVMKAKNLIEEGEIGEVFHIKGSIGNDGWQLKESWFNDAEMTGGGTLLDNGAHLLDIYRWFLGEVTECTGYTTSSYHSVEPLEDNAFAMYKFTDGKHGFLHSSWTEWDEYMTMEIYGSDGYIRVNNRHPTATVTLGDKNGYQCTYDYTKLPPESYDNEIEAYINDIQSGTHPEPTGYDGLRAVEMAHYLYESATKGQTVNLLDENQRRLFRDVQNRYGDEATTAPTADR